MSAGGGGGAGAGDIGGAGNEAGDGGELRCVEPERAGDPPCSGEVRELMDRPYCLKVPARYSGAAAPLVLLLHGYGASGQVQADYFDFDALAERHGLLLAKPDGTLNALGSRSWNAFASCCAGRNPSPPDDVAYLSALLDDVSASYAVDPQRIYVVGHSNGAFMAHRLACELSGRLAAIVSLAGAVDPEACAPEAPISVLEVHGTADELIKWEGGKTAGGTAPYPSVDDTLAFWQSANDCAAAETGDPLNLVCDTTSPGDETTPSESSCAGGSAVALWKMQDVGHIPAFVLPSWPEQVLGFLSRHARR